MWIVCQIGGREHYSIARGLQRAGQLGALVTDFWVPPGAAVGRLPGAERLVDRFHQDLGQAAVRAPNLRMLSFEILARLRKQQGWDRMMARNALFQQEVLKILAGLRTPAGAPQPPVTVFSYSYAAREIFREAKKRGWTTVLGQIDPGPGEDAIVRRLRAEYPEWAGSDEASPPAAYWDAWREECALADRIVVNSEWSRARLVEDGIEAAKIEIVPLAYEARPHCAKGGECEGDVRGREPGGRGQGNEAGSLNFLWLGQVIVRKGIQDLVAAARILGDGPWRIDVVGPHGELPPELPANLRFHGAVPRSQAAAWYERADVFVLPTHSDGFALTQLEAMSHGVPVIATPCCGEVVENGVNGWIVPAADPQALAGCIRRIAEAPEVLQAMRPAARNTAATFSLDAVAAALLQPQGRS